MLDVGVSPEVGFEQVVGPLLIRDPLVIEDDRRIQHPELPAQGHRLVVGAHLRHVGIRMAGSQEEQFDVVTFLRKQRHGTDSRERVQPVIDAAAPEQNPVVLTNSGVHALENPAGRHGRRLRQAKRHDIDELTQGAVPPVNLRGDPASHRQPAQPVIALPFRGADEKVADLQLPLERPDDPLLDASLLRQGQMFVLPHRLEGQGHIKIDDEELSHAGEFRILVEGKALGE